MKVQLYSRTVKNNCPGNRHGNVASRLSRCECGHITALRMAVEAYSRR